MGDREYPGLGEQQHPGSQKGDAQDHGCARPYPLQRLLPDADQRAPEVGPTGSLCRGQALGEQVDDIVPGALRVPRVVADARDDGMVDWGWWKACKAPP